RIFDRTDGYAYAAFKRSSMGDMACFLPRLRHDDEESIYVLRRIEKMWSDSNLAFTQGDHEPLVSQRLTSSIGNHAFFQSIDCFRGIFRSVRPGPGEDVWC